MNSPLTTSARLLAGTLLLASCANSPTPEHTQAPAAVETAVKTPTQPPAATPTEVPTPSLTVEAKIAAGLAAFEADPGDLIAWDLREATFSANSVNIEVCGWTGKTVYDDVYAFSYDVTQDTNGDPVVKRLFDATTTGDCLNTALLDSVIEATNNYTAYWATVLDDPTTFDPEEAALLKDPATLELDVELVGGWIRDGLRVEGHGYGAAIPDNAVADVLWRRYISPDTRPVFELVLCREHGQDIGLYKDRVLIDDFGVAGQGTHRVDVVRLVRVEGNWLILGGIGNTGANCAGADEAWLELINEWRSNPASWAAAVDV